MSTVQPHVADENNNPEAGNGEDNEPISQQKSGRPNFGPVWFRDHPFYRLDDLPEYKESDDYAFFLIQKKNIEKVKSILEKKGYDQASIAKALEEMDEEIRFMSYEILRLFRRRDYEAKRNQLTYRQLQIMFLILATIATVLGSLQAVFAGYNPSILRWFAFSETIVALVASFLAAIRRVDPPLPSWLNARRRAEALRREYFRYLMKLPPYHKPNDADEGREAFKRRQRLAQRAADINRGVFPRETSVLQETPDK